MPKVNYCLNSLVNGEVCYINNLKGMFSLSVPCIHWVLLLNSVLIVGFF